jgi:hypothetical protein
LGKTSVLARQVTRWGGFVDSAGALYPPLPIEMCEFKRREEERTAESSTPSTVESKRMVASTGRTDQVKMIANS